MSVQDRGNLRARLIGDVRFSFRGDEFGPSSRKGTGLLAYLCLRPEGATREDLAELLWGSGRLGNLRQELYALRRLPGAETWLQDQGDMVAVRADTDVARLDEAGSAPLDADVALDSVSSGPLLPGLERIAAPAYLDWLDLERRRVAELLLRFKVAAAERLSDEGRHHEALAHLQAALADEPLDESIVQAAMRTAYVAGDTGRALEHAAAFRKRALDELGSAPSAATEELERRIEAGEPLIDAFEYARFDADLKALAQAVAVAEGSLDVDQLAGVVERRPLDVASDLARLERGGWLDDGLRLRPAAEASTLAATSPVVRRLLHLRVAHTLRDSPNVEPAAVARHLLAGERATEAAPLWLEAGRRAVARGELEAASAALLRALWSGWEAPEVRLQAALLLEGCAAQLGDDGLQDRALAEAEALAWQLQTDHGLVDVRMRRSRTWLRRGRAGDALESALEALEIAVRLGDEQLVARARNAVGGAQFYAGDIEGAEQSFNENRDAADPIERYRARNNLGSLAGVRGRPREALAHLEVALTLGRAAGELASVVGTLNNLAATAERIGDYRRAVKYFKEGLSLARQIGSLSNEGQLLVNLSVVYSRLGELGPAWNTALEAEELAQERADPRLRMVALELRAEVSLLCGRFAGADALLEAAERSALEIGDERKQAVFGVSRAVMAAYLDRAAEESAVARLEALDEPRWADVTPWLWLELSLLASEPDVALRRMGKAESLMGENDHIRFLTDLCRLRAGLLQDAEPVELEASAAFDRLTQRLTTAESIAYVQAPHAELLCARWRERLGEATGHDLASTLERVRASLEEQGAGLPTELRDSLQRLPKFWQSAWSWAD